MVAPKFLDEMSRSFWVKSTVTGASSTAWADPARGTVRPALSTSALRPLVSNFGVRNEVLFLIWGQAGTETTQSRRQVAARPSDEGTDSPSYLGPIPGS